jgi:hypothetical protein
MQDLFACRQCHAIYAITRLTQAPALPPFCRNCGNRFPPTELGDWLAYERAEPEWTLDEWLSSSPQNRSNLCRTNDSTSAPFVGEFAARSEQSIANAMTPSGRMRELAAVPRTSSAPWPRSP